MFKKTGVLSCFLFLIVLLFPLKGFPMLIQKDLSEMVYEADSILVGKVIKMESRWTEDKGTIVTDVTIVVESYLKNPISTKEVVIQIPGGEVGEIGLKVSDVPSFRVDEEVLIFLKKDTMASWVTYHGAQGKYTIKDGMVEELGISVDTVVTKIEGFLKVQ